VTRPPFSGGYRQPKGGSVWSVRSAGLESSERASAAASGLSVEGQSARFPAGVSMPHTILTLNCGSSSLKFALLEMAQPERRLVTGIVDRIGLPDGSLRWNPGGATQPESTTLNVRDHAASLPVVLDLIAGCRGGLSPDAVGYRIVHGGTRYRQPVLLTDPVLADLRELQPFAIKHMPPAISVIEECRRRLPGIPHIGCFDTAFHADLPKVASLLPIPRRYFDRGIRRYGFHGLSFTYLMQELRRVGGDREASGRVILAHLGHGASMAAVKGGRSIDTTMALTPAAGLVMSTRAGDLDPGVPALLERIDGTDMRRFDDMIHNRSGLLGISETSPDVRDLLGREAGDQRAAEALAVFCYQCRKWIGALAAALGGLDTLVFAGGIGENAAVIRERICSGLEFIGITLDRERNAANAAVISAPESPVTVRVMRTDEELLIARAAYAMLRAGRGEIVSGVASDVAQGGLSAEGMSS